MADGLFAIIAVACAIFAACGVFPRFPNRRETFTLPPASARGVRSLRDAGKTVPVARGYRRQVNPSGYQKRRRRSALTSRVRADRRKILALLALTGMPFGAFAQQPNKVWRIGVLETTSIELNSVNLDAFRKGLQDLGYFEGRNFVIEYRSADGRSERFPDLVADLVNRRVDVIVFRGTPAAFAARKATQTIPLISVALGDPLLLVKSLARPGVNLTGLSSFTTDLDAKRVELLKQTIPSFKRIAVLGNMANLASVRNWNETEKAAIPIGVQPVLLDARKREDIAPALDKAVKERIDAVVVALDTVTQANRRLIVELVAERRLPTMYHAKEFVEVGGLMVYGPSYPDLYRRAATYVDKILKGANPAEIPVEQPIKLELVVNLKTAKALGITIPQSILLRADQLIE